MADRYRPWPFASHAYFHDPCPPKPDAARCWLRESPFASHYVPRFRLPLSGEGINTPRSPPDLLRLAVRPLLSFLPTALSSPARCLTTVVSITSTTSIPQPSPLPQPLPSLKMFARSALFFFALATFSNALYFPRSPGMPTFPPSFRLAYASYSH